MKKLVITILAAALILLACSWGLNSIAASNAQAEHIRLLQMLLPGSTEFTVEPYSGEDSKIRSVHKGENGYVIETVTDGYADEITMLIGVSKEGNVTGLVVREAHETVGLGNQALTDHEFLSQFLNSSGSFTIGVETDAFSGATGTGDGEADVTIDAISGATVTSKAIARSVNSAVGYVTGADASSGATTWGG